MIHTFKQDGKELEIESTQGFITLTTVGVEYRDYYNYPKNDTISLNLTVETARDIAKTLNHLADKLEEGK